MPRRLPLALALAGVAALSVTSLGTAASAAPLSHAQEQLKAVVLPNLSALTPLGAAPADTVMRIGIGLQRPHAAAEQAFLAGLNDPKSPDYHHFLTPAQIAERFGVSKDVTSLVRDQLVKAGLTVDQVATAGDYLSATGPVSAVDKALEVDIQSYRNGDGSTFLANPAGPFVPAAAHVLSVVGLNTLQHYSLPKGATDSKKREQDTCVQGICTGLTTPQDLWGVYDEPDAYRGAGESIAVIGEGSTKVVSAALPAFQKKYGLPHTPLVVHCVEKNDCGTDTDGDVEWEIDTQATSGMAPDAKDVQLYFSQTIYDGSLNMAFLSWIDDAKGPKIGNASLGECEATPANDVFTGPLAPIDGNLNGDPQAISATGNGEEYVLDPQLVKAVMQGKTLFASSGDTGSSCPEVYAPVIGGGNGVANQGVPQVGYPAASPSVVAVGGTVLYTDDGSKPTTRNTEYAWTFGGGGTSYFEAAPSWQSDTPTVVGRCVTDSMGGTGNTGVLCRGVPDVAAQSGDVATNGYGIVDPSGAVGSGAGTSLSSPLWAGMWTRVAAAVQKNTGKPAGFAAPLLYKVGNGATPEVGFDDVTVGTNGVYPTLPGWDYTTGFGTPRVAGLVSILAPKTAVTTPVTVVPPKAAPAPPTSPQPVASLPTTGLATGLPMAALVLLGAGLVVRRRRA